MTGPGSSLRKHARSSLTRTIGWISRQILIKDGGLVTSLRGVVAAGLLAVGARLIPHRGPAAWMEPVASVAVVAVLSVGVVLVIMTRGRRRRSSKEQPCGTAVAEAAVPVTERPAGSPRGIVQVCLHIEFVVDLTDQAPRAGSEAGVGRPESDEN